MGSTIPTTVRFWPSGSTPVRFHHRWLLQLVHGRRNYLLRSRCQVPIARPGRTTVGDRDLRPYQRRMHAQYIPKIHWIAHELPIQGNWIVEVDGLAYLGLDNLLSRVQKGAHPGSWLRPNLWLRSPNWWDFVCSPTSRSPHTFREVPKLDSSLINSWRDRSGCLVRIWKDHNRRRLSKIVYRWVPALQALASAALMTGLQWIISIPKVLRLPWTSTRVDIFRALFLESRESQVPETS